MTLKCVRKYISEDLPNEGELHSLYNERNHKNYLVGRRNNLIMDQEISIKEEVDILDTDLPNQKELYSTGHERNCENDTVTRTNNLEMDQEINIKEEVILDTNLPNESLCYPTYFRNKYDTVTCGKDFKLDSNTESKEQPLVSEIAFKKEEKFFSSDPVKKEFIMYNGTEVCVQGMSTETQCKSESGILLQSENRDVKTENGESAHASRLSVHATYHEACVIEAVQPLQIDKGVCFRRCKKFENDKTCISGLYSTSEILIKGIGIQSEPSGSIYPDKSALKLPDMSYEEMNICNSEVSQTNSIQQQQTMTEHKFIHECKRSHRCNVCNKSFTRIGTLKTHSLIHEGKRPHKCNVCNKSFTELGNLKTHSLIHEGKRPHKCDVCNKSFTQLGTLQKHSLIHEGKKPHKCNICNKTFTQLGSLQKHILIHEGKRPHKCSVCNKRFTQLGSLQKHTLIHEGKKPHNCGVCKRSFTELGNLKKHILIHEGKRPHKCNVCNKSFTELGTLKKHSLLHKAERPQEYRVGKNNFTLLANLKRGFD